MALLLRDARLAEGEKHKAINEARTMQRQGRRSARLDRPRRWPVAAIQGAMYPGTWQADEDAHQGVTAMGQPYAENFVAQM